MSASQVREVSSSGVAAPGIRKGDSSPYDDQGSGMEMSSDPREEFPGTQASRRQKGQILATQKTSRGKS